CPLERQGVRVGGGHAPPGEGRGRPASTGPPPRGNDPETEPGDRRRRRAAAGPPEAEGRGDGRGPGKRRGRARELSGAPGLVLLLGTGRAVARPDRGSAGPP